MQKNIFDYLEYSWMKLFSKEWTNIVGSSLIVVIGAGMTSLFLILGGGWWLATHMDMIPRGDEFVPGFMLSLLLFLSVILTLIIVISGWQAIVIPIRSIDGEAGLDWRGDWTLFTKHIGRYLGYVTWYSLAMFVLWILFLIILVSLWAVDAVIGVIFLIVGLIMIIYTATLFSVAWYHILSEGSGSWSMFWQSRKFVRGRVWKVFWQIFFYSLIVAIVANMIESAIYGILSWDVTGGAWDRIAGELQVDREKSLYLVFKEIIGVIATHPIAIFGSWLLMTLFFSLSSVLSSAMKHIFYVRYYLDLRESVKK